MDGFSLQNQVHLERVAQDVALELGSFKNAGSMNCRDLSMSSKERGELQVVLLQCIVTFLAPLTKFESRKDS